MYTHAHYNVLIHRILVAEHSLADGSKSGSSTTLIEDALVVRAQCGRKLVLDRMERISSMAKVSKRKHDRTHRKWFNDIIQQLVGKDAFELVGLDLSSV